MHSNTPIGHTPFDRESQEEEVAAICSGDFELKPGAIQRASQVYF